ncbi:MAG: hypothetical protein JXR77_16515 [Lentisphaeria bacterium]|nr:hypothetical protein [Lentisphaeria bacterium]
MSKQLFFEMDFAAHTRKTRQGAAAPAANGGAAKRRLAVRRAALRWLEQGDPPTGIGVSVITRIQRFRADIAAFWSAPVRNPASEGPGRVLAPARTAIIQCYTEREECWPDCSRSDSVLPYLRELKAEMAAVEAAIRAEEPELRDAEALFEEYARWRYDQTGNRRYHILRNQIEKTERSLYDGTTFERIRSAQLADRLYLAVPAGMVGADELADGWGLLWVEDSMQVKVVSEPEARDCLPSNRFHLIQHIAAAAKSSQLLVLGVAARPEGVVFTRPVFRRRVENGVRLP